MTDPNEEYPLYEEPFNWEELLDTDMMITIATIMVFYAIWFFIDKKNK